MFGQCSGQARHGVDTGSNVAASEILTMLSILVEAAITS